MTFLSQSTQHLETPRRCSKPMQSALRCAVLSAAHTRQLCCSGVTARCDSPLPTAGEVLLQALVVIRSSTKSMSKHLRYLRSFACSSCIISVTRLVHHVVSAPSCSTLLFLPAQSEMRAFSLEDVAQNCIITSFLFYTVWLRFSDT